MLIDYLKTVTGETRFLMCEPDEVKYTTEGELGFIKEHNESENGLLILAFVDGEYAGNCSFEGKTSSRRAKHRAGIGIALFTDSTVSEGSEQDAGLDRRISGIHRLYGTESDGRIGCKVYTIVEAKAGAGSVEGWGRLKFGIGWVSLDFCQRL